MAGIVLKDVTKRFGETWALRATSLAIKDHEFLVLVGPFALGDKVVFTVDPGLLHLFDPASGRAYR